jgi:quercetin dioxygenase-like cupin family protein
MAPPRPFVTETEWLARTDAVGVRVNTLGPGEGSPWHFHTAVTDDVFCMDPGIEVWLRSPDERIELAPGQRQRILAGRVHRVMNPSSTPARYLLIQATGRYDFNEVPD